MYHKHTYITTHNRNASCVSSKCTMRSTCQTMLLLTMKSYTHTHTAHISAPHNEPKRLFNPNNVHHIFNCYMIAIWIGCCSPTLHICWLLVTKNYNGNNMFAIVGFFICLCVGDAPNSGRSAVAPTHAHTHNSYHYQFCLNDHCATFSISHEIGQCSIKKTFSSTID